MKVELQKKIDLKTKPRGALGQLEKLALQIGTVQQSLEPTLSHPSIVVFAADHGAAKAGVSAYPPEVTHQMVLNFLNGGAAINVFCRQHRLHLEVVDAGVAADFESHPRLVSAKVGKGTRNYLQEPAMTPEQQQACFSHGARIVKRLKEKGCNVIGFGEMGIGNTASAALLMSRMCQLPIAECVGRGTGLNDTGLARKIQLLETALALHSEVNEPLAVLQTFGGFEMAQMAGAMLEAGRQNMLLLVDGFIASAAFLVAQRLEPSLQPNAIFCHLSDEQGHRKMLDVLNAEPLLQLNLRLGEGTGCALAYPLLESAVAFLRDMASFESAGVSAKTEA
ncbi:MAG: nicotinate-nucleotide--dimethylbenzimidazole phosphoribosyltransferase [Salibacteraceae bacterium]